MSKTGLLPRGKRPSRSAAAVSASINNALLERGRKLCKPAEGSPRITMPQSILSFIPSQDRRLGVGVKNVRNIRGPRNNKHIKIKKLLVEPKEIEITKNGVVQQRKIVRRKTYFPGRRQRVY